MPDDPARNLPSKQRGPSRGRSRMNVAAVLSTARRINTSWAYFVSPLDLNFVGELAGSTQTTDSVQRPNAAKRSSMSLRLQPKAVVTSCDLAAKVDWYLAIGNWKPSLKRSGLQRTHSRGRLRAFDLSMCGDGLAVS